MAAQTLKPDTAPLTTGLSSIFVQVGDRRMEAKLRPDLGRGVFDVFVEADGEVDGEDRMRFFQVEATDGWPVVTDVTERVEAEIVARQNRLDERRERDKVGTEARLQVAANSTPTTVRKDHDAVIDEWSDTAGVKRLRVRTPLQRLHASRLLTGRQFSAGQALHEDFLLSQMVRQPADEGGGRAGYGNGGADACFETTAVMASTRITRARIRCDRQDPAIWPVVDAVAIREVTVSDLADSSRGRDRAPYMLALRAGLDIIGDGYGMPSGYATTQVRVGSLSVPMEVAEDHEDLWRARSLNGWPWTAEGKTAGDVYALARTEMRGRVARILGFGPYRDSDYGDAIDADRAAGKAAEAERKADERRRADLLSSAVTSERKRVVSR